MDDVTCDRACRELFDEMLAKDAHKTAILMFNSFMKADKKLESLETIARKVVLAFPAELPEGQKEVSFNLPAYIIEELRNNLSPQTKEM